MNAYVKCNYENRLLEYSEIDAVKFTDVGEHDK